jgi:hypothetical protein
VVVVYSKSSSASEPGWFDVANDLYGVPYQSYYVDGTNYTADSSGLISNVSNSNDRRLLRYSSGCVDAVSVTSVIAGTSMISDPVPNASTVSPSDSVDLSSISTAIYIGTTGNLKVTMMNAEVVTFMSLPIGFHPIRVRRVWSTGTTASNIIAVWQ